MYASTTLVLMSYHHGNLREALLRRAAQVIAEGGVEAVSLRGLARDLDVSHAAPRRHFADRGALLAALAQEGFRRSLEAMENGAREAGDDPIARYRALGRSYVRFACEDPAYFRAINHPEVSNLADDALGEVKQRWFAALREGAEAAQQAGWHPEADPRALVAFSIAGANGAAALFADERWHDVVGGCDAETLADDVLDLIVHKSRTSAPRSTKKTTSRRKGRSAS